MNEVFDKPLQYSRSKSQEEYIRDMLPARVGYHEVYGAKLGPDVVYFYLFLVNGKHYELHFLNSANDFNPIGTISKYKANELTRIIATGNDIVVAKLKQKTTPILIYGSDERKTSLFKRAIKSKYPNVLFQDVKNVKGIDGDTYSSGFYVKQDTRTLKLEQLIQNLITQKANK